MILSCFLDLQIVSNNVSLNYLELTIFFINQPNTRQILIQLNFDFL